MALGGQIFPSVPRTLGRPHFATHKAQHRESPENPTKPPGSMLAFAPGCKLLFPIQADRSPDTAIQAIPGPPDHQRCRQGGHNSRRDLAVSQQLRIAIRPIAVARCLPAATLTHQPAVCRVLGSPFELAGCHASLCCGCSELDRTSFLGSFCFRSSDLSLARNSWGTECLQETSRSS